MKKLILCLLPALLMLASESRADDDIHWSGAFKIYSAQFSNHSGDTSATNSTGNLSITGSKDNFFVTASTLMPASYNFDKTSTYLKRSDTDLAFGWHFSEPFSVVLGRKDLSYSGNVANSSGSMLTTYTGLSGNKLITEKSFIYGTALISLASKDTGLDTTKYNQTNHFNSTEIGYGYYFSNRTQFTIGYRQQNIKSSLLNGSSETDKISGFLFGANVNFY